MYWDIEMLRLAFLAREKRITYAVQATTQHMSNNSNNTAQLRDSAHTGRPDTTALEASSSPVPAIIIYCSIQP